PETASARESADTRRSTRRASARGRAVFSPRRLPQHPRNGRRRWTPIAPPLARRLGGGTPLVGRDGFGTRPRGRLGRGRLRSGRLGVLTPRRRGLEKFAAALLFAVSAATTTGRRLGLPRHLDPP